jgi:uncharacterized RDD family membrane protein YckC
MDSKIDKFNQFMKKIVGDDGTYNNQIDIVEKKDNKNNDYIKKEKYAGFWIRFLSYIIDYIVLIIPSIIMKYIIDKRYIIINILVGFILMWLYYALMESSKYQGTLGKMILNLKITDLNYNKISFEKATLRFLGKFLSIITFGIGFLMIGFTEKKQGLHDKISNCIVIKE